MYSLKFDLLSEELEILVKTKNPKNDSSLLITLHNQSMKSVFKKSEKMFVNKSIKPKSTYKNSYNQMIQITLVEIRLCRGKRWIELNTHFHN